MQLERNNSSIIKKMIGKIFLKKRKNLTIALNVLYAEKEKNMS